MTPLALLLLVQQTTGRYAAGRPRRWHLRAGRRGGQPGRRPARRPDRPGAGAARHRRAAPARADRPAAGRRGGEAALPLIFVTSALAGATYPPLTAAIRGAWNDMTEVGTGRHACAPAALAAETSLFELVFVLGPMLVAAFVVITHDPAAALIGRGRRDPRRHGRGSPGCRSCARWQPHAAADTARGLGPLRAGGFPALLVCVAALGIAFGAAGVIVPAYAHPARRRRQPRRRAARRLGRRQRDRRHLVRHPPAGDGPAPAVRLAARRGGGQLPGAGGDAQPARRWASPW